MHCTFTSFSIEHVVLGFFSRLALIMYESPVTECQLKVEASGI